MSIDLTKFGPNVPPPPGLPPRWYPLAPHPIHMKLVRTSARFIVVPAGRRSGKTERAKRHVIRAAMRSHADLPHIRDPRYFMGAPTRDQAKRIFWSDLKQFIAPELRLATSESELFVTLRNGATIQIIGMDKPERIEGTPWDGGVLDEYANMKPKAWPDHVRPALSTIGRPGWCWLTGVPEGRNHYYDLWKYAISGADAEWAGFTWRSSDLLALAEVEAARRQLDELTFQQEYEGSFVSFEGRAYYPFLENVHCAPLRYDPQAPLAFCFDFNVDPGVSAICQEQKLPNGETGTGVIGEVYIPRNSNSVLVGKKLLNDWKGHKGPIRCYGDASGGARGSAKVQGSDWDLLKDILRKGDGTDLKGFGDRVTFRVPAANPSERSRVNAVNCRLRAMDGTVRMMVDPAKAPHVVKDLEGVKTVEGGSGEIDKKSDKRLTHISDGLGYYIVKEFPVVRGAGGVIEIEGY